MPPKIQRSQIPWGVILQVIVYIIMLAAYVQARSSDIAHQKSEQEEIKALLMKQGDKIDSMAVKLATVDGKVDYLLNAH